VTICRINLMANRALIQKSYCQHVRY